MNEHWIFKDILIFIAWSIGKYAQEYKNQTYNFSNYCKFIAIILKNIASNLKKLLDENSLSQRIVLIKLNGSVH